MLRHICSVVQCALCLTLVGTPSFAYLYDAGIAQHLGVSIKMDSNCEWVAAPFEVEQDCYATTLGAALARAIGPVDTGLDVYLTTTWSGLPESAIAKLSEPLIPLTTQYVYYYGSLSEPVFLQAGTIYSLVLIPTSPSLLSSLSFGAKPGTYYGWGTGDDGENWYQLSYPVCVRVDGYVVPEPSSVASLVFGLVPLCFCRRRRVAI